MTSERKVVVITGASRGIKTIPGMPRINHDQYDIDGIRVERFTTAPKDAAQRPPLICVHGGCHASWSWQEHAPVYAAAGYEVHALNWRGRGGSAAINDDLFVKMSIADVVDDIEKVARRFNMPPVVIAHSMGGLAAQLYASAHEVGALVLLTPVVPSNVGAKPIELPIGDMDAPWGPPPPDVARQIFFQGLDDMQGAPRPRIALAGLRGDALVACRRRDETHRAYPYRVGCARHFDAARNWRSARRPIRRHVPA